MSTLDDLWADLEEQEAKPWYRRRWNRPDRVARRWAGKVNGARRSLRHAYQRVDRGWDDRSLWSLDFSLCNQLGAQLLELALTTHSHPSDRAYDAWTQELWAAGQALSAYEVDPFLSDEDQEARILEAQTALRWVADNLTDLWD